MFSLKMPLVQNVLKTGGMLSFLSTYFYSAFLTYIDYYLYLQNCRYIEIFTQHRCDKNNVYIYSYTIRNLNYVCIF